MRSFFSNTVTSCPARASCCAAARPAGPEPTTATFLPVRALAGLGTTQPPTQTHRESLELAEAELAPLAAKLRQTIEVELAAIEKQLNALGAPWTPGRLPR